MSKEKITKPKREPRPIKFIEALLLLVVSVAILVLNATSWGMGTAMGLLYCTVLCIVYGILVLGYTWESIFKSVLKVCSTTMPVLYILLMCGVLQASWLMGGTVPYIIYVGLDLLTPSVYLVLTFVICFIAGIVTGSGWGVLSTIGLALVSVGNALGVPLVFSVGAIVGGSMNGDRFSPLVDTFNLCAATSGSNTIKQWKSMSANSIIGFIVSCILYVVLGMTIDVGSAEAMLGVSELTSGLASSFNLNLFALAPVVLIVVLLMLKVDTIPAFIASSFLGLLNGVIFQGVDFFSGSAMLWNGYVSETGIESIDSLLSMGGLMGNAGLVMLLFVAFVFAGTLTELGVLKVLLSGIVAKIKNAGALVLACTVTGLAGVFVSTSVFVSVILNAEIYKSAFRKKELAPEVLGRTLVEGCAFASCYVPWSGGGILVTSALLGGTWTFGWIPFAFCGWIPTVVNIVFAFLGINMKKQKYDSDLNEIADSEPQAEPAKA